MGSDDSRFNVAFTVEEQSRNLTESMNNDFEEQEELKWNRTHVSLLTSITPYALPLGPIGTRLQSLPGPLHLMLQS